MKRILIVYNPNSSNYVRVRDEVLSRVTELKSYMVGKFAIKKAPFKTNVSALKKILKDGDLVIAAGGDATAAVTANAILESGRDVTLGVLPYGNFNDLARTLGTMKFNDIKMAIEGGLSRGSGAWQGEDERHDPCGDRGRGRAPRKATSITLYPLDIIVDGKHWRYATCYVTMGMTAEAVELFDEPKFRKYMQKGHKSSWRSYLALAKWYFKNRHKKQFIPDFKLNGTLQPKKTSDYAAVSGRSMCRVMKGGNDYLKPVVFRSVTDRLANFWRLSKLMAISIFSRTPGTETKGDTIDFLQPATVELQAEGEYEVFENVKTIRVEKPADKFIKVIHI